MNAVEYGTRPDRSSPMDAPTPDPDLFAKAGLIRLLGIQPQQVGDGRAIASFEVGEAHTQHHGFVHAGAVATLADHTAGAAANALLPPGKAVLTVEFKVNLLKPVTGPRVTAEAEVLRAGRQLHVVESRVYAGDPRALVAVALVTLSVVDTPAVRQ